MHDRMFSSETAVVSTKEKNQLQLEVNEADPRVYVEVLDQRETLYAKTVFLLHNRGQDVAHRVQIQPLKLNCGEATFPSVEVLGQDEEKPVVPEIEKITPIWRHDISRILLKEWDHAGDISVLEFIRPMSITYEDYNSKRKWETTFDLVYHAVQDILERDWKLSEKPELLQVRNIKFKPLFS